MAGSEGRAMNNNLDSRKRVEVLLFVVGLLTFAYFYQASDQSTAARFDLMRSLVGRHSLWIDGYCGYNTADIINLRGHYYSVKAPGGSLTGIVQWIFVTAALSPLLHWSPSWFWALSTYLTIVLSTSLLVALLAVVFFRFALHLGSTVGRAAGLSLVLIFATILFPYATEMTGEPIAAVAVFMAFYLLATYERAVDSSRAWVAGMLAGWAVLCDFPAILISGALAVYALRKLPRWNDVAAFALGAGIVAAILMAYDWVAFGSPLFLSYQAYRLAGNTQFPEQAAGFVGVTYPRLQILWKVLFDPQRGLFFCNPVLLLALPGFTYFWRRRRYRAEFAIAVFAALAFILFNGSFGTSIVSWGGGTATGPRQMTAAIPFMVLSLAFLPEAWNYLTGALAAVSAFFMLIATATNPHFPYEFQNPIFDYALPAYLRGDFAYNKDRYFGGSVLIGDSVAFNLGGLAGLPGPIQLWPLGALWIGVGIALVKKLRAPNRRATSSIDAGAVGLGIAALFVVPISGPLAGALARTQGQHGLLGRYYEGLNPGGFPPHIVRVDRRLDFRSIAEMGALPFPSCVVWSGQIAIAQPGLYRFRMLVDDAGWLKVDGRWVIRDPGAVFRGQEDGAAYLAPGSHPIEVGERNVAGDAHLILYWQPPGGAWEIVPSGVLIADSIPVRRRQ